MQNHRINPVTLLFVTGMFMLQATAAYADDTQADNSAPPAPPVTPPVPGVQIKGSENLTWDSNPLMLPGSQKDLFGSITAPELVLTSKTPTDNFSSDTILDENIFNQSAFNSTDFHEKANLSRQMSQWGAGIQGSVDYDTTRTSEITTYGLDLPYVRHTGLSATPDISYNLTSVDKFIFSATAAKSSYDNAAFTNYEVFSFNPSYEHNFDPMNKGIFTLNVQRYQTTEGPTNKVDSIGPTVGWETLLTPRFTVKVDGGFQKSMQNSTLEVPGSSSWNYVFDADLNYKGQQNNADLIASRAQYPFANGTDTLLTSFLAKGTHAINDKIELNAMGNYQFANQPTGLSGTITLDKEYGAGGGLTYHLLQHLDATASYEYKNETLIGLPGTINDNVVLVGLAFHPFDAVQ